MKIIIPIALIVCGGIAVLLGFYLSTVADCPSSTAGASVKLPPWTVVTDGQGHWAHTWDEGTNMLGADVAVEYNTQEEAQQALERDRPKPQDQITDERRKAIEALCGKPWHLPVIRSFKNVTPQGDWTPDIEDIYAEVADYDISGANQLMVWALRSDARYKWVELRPKPGFPGRFLVIRHTQPKP
jgi:hypothetical protein